MGELETSSGRVHAVVNQGSSLLLKVSETPQIPHTFDSLFSSGSVLRHICVRKHSDPSSVPLGGVLVFWYIIIRFFKGLGRLRFAGFGT